MGDTMKNAFQLAAALCAFLAGVSTSKANSWYPPSCTLNAKCAHLSSMSKVPGTEDEFYYTTPHGSVVINSTTAVLTSPDHRIYVCIRENRMVCLFFPPF